MGLVGFQNSNIVRKGFDFYGKYYEAIGRCWIFIIATVASTSGCASSSRSFGNDQAGLELVGAGRARMQSSSGTFATVKDLEFRCVFHAGGALAEDSNYDAASPVPPAYRVWEKIGDQLFQA